jgi:hypothetical protein
MSADRRREMNVVTLKSDNHLLACRRMGKLAMPLLCPGLSIEDESCNEGELQLAMAWLSDEQREILSREENFVRIDRYRTEEEWDKRQIK